jgi:nucleoid-associated protein YejK
LLGRGGPAGIHTAAGQQGLLQIVRDFCDHSNAICADCQFPALVRSFCGL